jgi:hypothetical protein
MTRPPALRWRPILRGIWLYVGNPAQDNGLAVGKFSDEGQIASHVLDPPSLFCQCSLQPPVFCGNSWDIIPIIAGKFGPVQSMAWPWTARPFPA